MSQPVEFRPRQVATAKRIKGNSGTPGAPQIAAGTTEVLASVDLLKNAAPVLESLYYDGDAAGTRYLRFTVEVDGVPLPFDWADSYNPIGEPGKPAPIGENLPPGRKLEIKCKNEHATDGLEAFCDGEVAYYEEPLG